jgi:K+-transporting ATPase A subunit
MHRGSLCVYTSPREPGSDESASLTNVFGRMVANQRQGWALCGFMGILWLVGVIIAYSFKASR